MQIQWWKYVLISPFKCVLFQVSGRIDGYRAVHQHMVEQTQRLEQTLAGLMAYDGSVAIDDTETMTPEQLILDAVAMATFHADLEAQANSSWASIRNLTTGIETANGTMEGLVRQMKAALDVIDEAKRISETAISLINTTTGVQFDNNALKLVRLAAVVGEFTRIVAEVTDEIASAMVLVERANASVDGSYNMSQAKLSAAEEMSTRAMVAKYSASEAQRAALTAQSAANSYLVRYWIDLLITCTYQFNLLSVIFLEVCITLVIPWMCSFLILSCVSLRTSIVAFSSRSHQSIFLVSSL